MIIDALSNASRYYGIHPLFEKAFSYIQQTKLEEITEGKFEIEGIALRAIYSNMKGVSAADSVSEFECHNQHIDIQVCIHGTETIGWKPREKCINENGDYHPDKDVQLYNENPDMFFQLTDKQFVIFFPEDVHAPMIGDDRIHKLVIKVKI